MKNRKLNTILAIAVIALVCVIIYFVLTRTKPKTTVFTEATVFSSFGPTNSYMTNVLGWTVRTKAHAEWFVPNASGSLSAIELAIEPNYGKSGRQETAGNADIFIAQDENGFPGTVFERFSIVANPPGTLQSAPPLVFNSVTHPILQAGVKYWLSAECSGPGTWVWHFNNQNLTQVSARQQEQDTTKWASAGNGRNGAFSIIVTQTNRLQ